MSFIVSSYFRQPPPVWEVAVPFDISYQGEVRFDTDPYMWARNHILALLLTTPGERVMRPTYGAGLRTFVFENNDPFVEAQLVNRIQAAVMQWEPNIRVADIELVPQPPDWGTMELRMAITVGNAPVPHNVAFTISNMAVEVRSLT